MFVEFSAGREGGGEGIPDIISETGRDLSGGLGRWRILGGLDVVTLFERVHEGHSEVRDW